MNVGIYEFYQQILQVGIFKTCNSFELFQLGFVNSYRQTAFSSSLIGHNILNINSLPDKSIESVRNTVRR